VAPSIAAPWIAHARPIAAFYGRWQIDSLAGLADASAGETQSEKTLDSTATLSSNEHALTDVSCHTRPVLRTVDVDTILLNDWNTRRSNLKLGKFHLATHARSIDAGCGFAFILGNNELQGGAFHLASRHTPLTPAAGP
jgi:hypothetical protein